MAIDLATMSPGEAAYILAGLGFTEAIALLSHMQPNQVLYIRQSTYKFVYVELSEYKHSLLLWEGRERGEKRFIERPYVSKC